jgi:secretion/DNA translocation related TadE-like protein
VVVLVGVLTVLALGGAVAGGVMVGQRRAAAAADLAALAGAEAVAQATVGGSGCARAAEVATLNGAAVTSCSVQGREVVVGVTVEVERPFGGSWAVPARARAGPVLPTAGGGAGP